MISTSSDLHELIEQAREKWFELFVAGPKRLRWEELPPQIGEPAPDLELQDSTGTERRLGEFWADGPTLLLFWRHFGCGCGTARAKQLADEYDEYVDAGATVGPRLDARIRTVQPLWNAIRGVNGSNLNRRVRSPLADIDELPDLPCASYLRRLDH